MRFRTELTPASFTLLAVDTSRGGFMDRSIRAPRLTAAGAAAIVALGVVSAPDTTHPVIPRPVHVSAIQLQSSSAQLTRATAHTTAAITATNRTAASTPQAKASAETLIGSAVILAGLIALTPAWYVGFPITVPISLLLAYGLKSLFFPGGGIRELVTFGVGIYAIAPVIAIAYAFTPFAALAAPAGSARQSSTVTKPNRQVRDGNRGLAGSKRGTNPGPTADRRAPVTRTAKATAAAPAKKTTRGAASSARGAQKRTQS